MRKRSNYTDKKILHQIFGDQMIVYVTSWNSGIVDLV